MIDRIKRWLGGPSLDPPGPPVAAVTLPSGEVLVFDRAGHVLEKAARPTERVKGSIAQYVGTAGRFFRIVGETQASGWGGWISTSSSSSHAPSGRWIREAALSAPR